VQEVPVNIGLLGGQGACFGVVSLSPDAVFLVSDSEKEWSGAEAFWKYFDAPSVRALGSSQRLRNTGRTEARDSASRMKIIFLLPNR
jgi:hypothetical protein